MTKSEKRKMRKERKITARVNRKRIAAHVKGKEVVMFVLVIGSVLEGLSFVGPFDCPEDAVAWADEYCEGEAWQFAPLEDQTT